MYKPSERFQRFQKGRFTKILFKKVRFRKMLFNEEVAQIIYSKIPAYFLLMESLLERVMDKI